MTPRRIYGLTVGKNEAGRYLGSYLRNVLEAVDVLFYYDDQSTDGSWEIVNREEHSPKIFTMRRPDHVPSFLDHEGKFRQAAYDSFEKYITPRHMIDWVLAIDTDEVLVGPTECRPCELDRVIDDAERGYGNCGAVLMPIDECFGYDESGWPMIRKDGEWGHIKGTRLFRYQMNGKFRDVPMACGSEPDYVTRTRGIVADAGPLSILHHGYADPADLKDKYERYSQRTGHSSAHVESIPLKPTLIKWPGLIPPDMKRGTHE